MNIRQILRWVMIAIVLLVAVALFSATLKVSSVLLGLALKGLLILLLVAVVLRFIGLLKERRH